MNAVRVEASLIALLAACGGSSHGDDDDDDRCAMVRECFPADSIGCCGASATRVSVCDACPVGMVERRTCRTAGCTDPCMSGSIVATDSGAGALPAAVTCFVDTGPGCCGEQVFHADMCGACPTGSKPASMCTSLPDICNSRCDEAGVPAMPGPGSSIADPAPTMCMRQLSQTCCGDFVTTADPCGQCPMGSVPMTECMAFPSSAPPSVTCRQDYGGGCCGGATPADACGTGCAWGGTPESACTDTMITDGGMTDAGPSDGGAMEPPPDGGAGVPPPPIPAPPTCRMDLGMGCCGEIVPMGACSPYTCPAGSVESYSCTGFAPACGGG